MTQGKPRDAWKEQEWRRRVGEWRKSGLSVRAFCAGRGLEPWNFYAWRRELAKRDAQSAAFVPVQIVAEPVAGGDAGLAVVLDGGRTIRVTPGFDAATLLQLLAVLEEQPRC